MSRWEDDPSLLFRLRAALASGLSYAQAARKLSITRGMVSGKINRLNGYTKPRVVPAYTSPNHRWSEAALTERWADRKQRKASCAPASSPSPTPRSTSSQPPTVSSPPATRPSGT